MTARRTPPRPSRSQPSASSPSAPRSATSLLQSPWLHAALVVIAVVAAYYRTLGVPFYLDDFSSIRENDLIYRWRGLGPLFAAGPMRVMGYLTLALNYRVGGFEPAGYHLVNLAIHALAGLAVLGLTRGLMRTPRLESAPSVAKRWLPLVVALMFVLHPLQTQAVTYIVQRLASLVALFYLTSMACYVQARLATRLHDRVLWSVSCAVAMLLAFLAKENAVTLPAALWLVEALLFRASRRRLAIVAVAAIAIEVVPWWLLSSAQASHGSLDQLTRETLGLSRGSYLATQMVTLAHYLRLFVWPVGLHLDYAFPIRRGFGDPAVLAATCLHLALVGVAAATWRRRPLVAFGIVFCYLAHAVESSVFPIRDVIFEHRTYLPNVGLCLALTWLLVAELPRTSTGARVASPLIPVLLVACAATTWARNEVWRDPVAFWRDNVRLARTKPRPWAMLGRNLLDSNQPKEALDALGEATALREKLGDRGTDRDLDAINTMWALRLLGRHDEALALYAAQDLRATPPAIRSKYRLNAGIIELDRGRFASAETLLGDALRDVPNSLPAMGNLASALAERGRTAEAESLFLEVLRIDPGDSTTRFNLGQVRMLRARTEGREPGAEGPGGRR